MAGTVAFGEPNLVKNGSFEESSYPQGGGSYYWANSPSYVTDWAAAAYGSDGGYAGDYTGYWFAPGPGYQWYIPTSFTNVSSVPGDTLAPGATQKDPDGGYFIYLDGEPGWGSGIQQTIDGLEVGKTYQLSFYWAVIQPTPYATAYYEDLEYTLGGSLAYYEPLTTPPDYVTQSLSEPAAGFSGWLKNTTLFTATSASEFLEFAAVGGPYGSPPGTLIDGVSLTYVPEPATWALIIVGIGAIGGISRRRALSSPRPQG
jgi:hypothetical protein